MGECHAMYADRYCNLRICRQRQSQCLVLFEYVVSTQESLMLVCIIVPSAGSDIDIAASRRASFLTALRALSLLSSKSKTPTKYKPSLDLARCSSNHCTKHILCRRLCQSENTKNTPFGNAILLFRPTPCEGVHL